MLSVHNAVNIVVCARRLPVIFHLKNYFASHVYNIVHKGHTIHKETPRNKSFGELENNKHPGPVVNSSCFSELCKFNK